MTSELQNLQDAVTIIETTRRKVAEGSIVVWRKLLHASLYLDKQIAALLAE